MAEKEQRSSRDVGDLAGKMEKGFNSLTNQAVASPQFSKVANRVGGVSAGAQKQIGDLMEKYLASMNLPGRSHMESMAERLQSIEGQLNEMKALLHQVLNNSDAPDDGYTSVPNPPRTKRPTSTDGVQK
jgi:Poly(R)-hydroxyalkanoic acid synthase subunit (PHA_synth_III_E)